MGKTHVNTDNRRKQTRGSEVKAGRKRQSKSHWRYGGVGAETGRQKSKLKEKEKWRNIKRRSLGTSKRRFVSA